MRNLMFGITNIKVKHFVIIDDNFNDLNNFLKKYDGDIIDIQYQQNDFTAKQILVIYKGE